MLITHLKPDQLLGKKVYDNDGRLLGVVVGITGRRGRVKAVVLSNRQKAFRPLAALSNLVVTRARANTTNDVGGASECHSQR